MDVSGALPPYLTFETALYLFYILVGLLVVNISRLLIGIHYSFKQPYTLLEIKPTDKTSKTPLATSQLFHALHSLTKSHSWFEKLIKVRKSISYELVATKNDGIRYLFRVPTPEVSSTRKAITAYLSGIEISQVEDCLSEPNDSVTVREFKLQKQFLYPLRKHTTLEQHDPIAYLTGQMTKLNPEELIGIQIVGVPVQVSTHASVVGKIREIKAALLNNEDITHILTAPTFSWLLDIVVQTILFLTLTPVTLIAWFIGPTKDPLPSWVINNWHTKVKPKSKSKSELYDHISQKISQPLFESRIRIYIKSSDKQQRISRLKGITSAFDAFESNGQAVVLQRSLNKFLQLKLLSRIYQFIYQYRLALLPNHNTILSADELSSIYHLPYTPTTKTEDLIQTKSPKLPAPISLKKTDLDLDITFATNTYGETETPIGLTLEERRRHTYILGATGTGKSTLLLHMIHQDLVAGNGLAVVDPHGDLSERLLGVIPKERVEDVIYFNPYDIEYPIGLNLLELPKGLSNAELQREKDFITSMLISIFHKLYDPKYSGPRMEHVLRNVILTALEQKNPTLFTIYDLLTNKSYRDKVTNKLDDKILKAFWKNEFGKLGSYQRAEMISPITNKLGRFLTTTMTRNILNQKQSKLDFDQIMNDKKILICNLAKGKIGEDVTYFLGNLITAKLQLTALRRVLISEKNRPDFFLYIDEFQNFATQSFAQILSEARKYRLSVILAHQNTVQIDNDLLETIIGNTGTLICFRTSSPRDEAKLLPVFVPEVEKGQIANLPSYNFYIKINALQPQATFSGGIDNFVVDPNEKIQNEVIEHSQKTFGEKIESPRRTTKPKQLTGNIAEMRREVPNASA